MTNKKQIKEELEKCVFDKELINVLLDEDNLEFTEGWFEHKKK